MGHPNLPPAGGAAPGGHPGMPVQRGTPLRLSRRPGGVGPSTSCAIPISGRSVARGCSRLGALPPPDEAPAQKATRGCSGPALPPPVPRSRTPRDTPERGDGFGEGAVAVPTTLPLLPEPRTPPSPAGGCNPRRTDTVSPAQPHRLGRGGGCWEEAPPAPRGIAGIYRYWAGSTAPGPSQFPQFLPLGSRFLGAVTARSLHVPGVPLSPCTTNSHRGGHRLLLCSPDTAPNSHSSGHPGDPPGSGCSRSCFPTPRIPPGATRGRP